MVKKRDTVSLEDKDVAIKSSVDNLEESMNATISTLTQSIKNTTITIGSDIKVLQDSVNKSNSDIINAHNEINTLRRENKALNNALSDSKSRIVLLEENYNNIVDNLDTLVKIASCFFIVFIICIAYLAYEIYILTH